MKTQKSENNNEHKFTIAELEEMTISELEVLWGVKGVDAVMFRLIEESLKDEYLYDSKAGVFHPDPEKQQGN